MVRVETSDAGVLMSQASGTANEYLVAAIHNIDSELGEGYAKKHPEAIAAFMQTAGYDYRTTVYLSALNALVDALPDVVDAIRSIAPNGRGDF